MHTTQIVLTNPAARTRALLALILLSASLGAAAPVRSAVAPVTITLDLARYPKVAHLDAGEYVGVSPGRIVVHVGETVVFVNSDTRHHTATFLGDEGVFPQNPRWTDSALRASGTIGAEAWSTGDLAPGARSGPIAASKAGTYLYGCFFDYSAGMRGEIVVVP